MQESVNDFHFERLPMAPIRGKACHRAKHPHLQQGATTVEDVQGLQNNHVQAKEYLKIVE